MQRGLSGPRPVMNRGPLERWIGFVFATLKRNGHEALRVCWGTNLGPLSYGVATLDRDLCAASVLAIDLARLTTAAEEAANRERASCSPFSVPSMEEQGVQWVENVPPPPPPPENYTLGQLVDDLQRFGESYHQQAELIRQQSPIAQRGDWIRLAVLVSHARASLQRIPGFNELRALAKSMWEEEMSFVAGQRIVDALVERSNGSLSPSEVEGLTLSEAVSRLSGPTALAVRTDGSGLLSSEASNAKDCSVSPPVESSVLAGNPAPPSSPAASTAGGLLCFDLPTIFRCAVELVEAVASIVRSEWDDLPSDIEGTASPHFERWCEWHRRLSRIEEESARLKRALGATGPLTCKDRLPGMSGGRTETPSAEWRSLDQKFADTAHDRVVRLALMKLATAAIDLSGFANWRQPQWDMRERGLRLLTWGLAQLWEGLAANARSGVRDRLRRTHSAIGWPRDPAAEPPRYDGPETIPLEDQYRVVAPEQGYVTCYADYLDDIQKASNEEFRQQQEQFLRRATVTQFVALADRTAQTLQEMVKREFNTLGQWANLYTKAFFPLLYLQRAKGVKPIADWPEDAIEQRNLLADTVRPLLVCIGAIPEAKGTLKPEEVNKAFEEFTRATNRLREIANPQVSRAAVQMQAAGGKPEGQPRVVLRGRDEGPLVLGKEKPRLTDREYNVVKAVLDASEHGLTKDKLDEKSGHSESRKVLAALRDSDPDWAAVIQMPGKAGMGGYRIK
jgi:hypothetical protein